MSHIDCVSVSRAVRWGRGALRSGGVGLSSGPGGKGSPLLMTVQSHYQHVLQSPEEREP